MDRLAAMEVFVAVAAEQGFAKAARRLGISTSAVSKHIASLEQRLGARLLNRTTRRIGLTEAGERYLAWSSRIVTDAREADAAVTELQTTPRGRLRLSAPVSFGILHLSPLIPEFLARCPDLDVELTLNDRAVDLVEEGYDAALRIAALADSTLRARRLAPSRLLVVASPSYVAAAGAPRAPDDLSSHDCLRYSVLSSRLEWSFKRDGQRWECDVAGKLHSNNGDVLRDAALGGSGIAILPSFLVGPDVAAGRLLRLLPEFETREAAIHVVYPPGRQITAKLRVLIDFLVARFGPEPYWDAGL